MNQVEYPYICQCGFCEQGLLRPMRCKSCQAIVAICDECELTWQDMEAVSRDPATASSSSFPACPACGKERSIWLRLTREQTSGTHVEPFVAGESP